jgi:hypothetical protein
MVILSRIVLKSSVVFFLCASGNFARGVQLNEAEG